ncbi:MAG: hypothetical protein J5505_01080 [Spirochaetaceae bacterium]|nr:hypothetical protein [Spirochaetaceae bacterium]
MAEQITNYKCPACTGPLKFSSTTGKLECEYCGGSFDPKEIESMYAQKDEKAAEAFNKEQEKQEKQQEEQKEEISWDTSAEQNTETMNMKTYSCPSCGAEVICEVTTAATSCPYCGNPSIVPGQMTGSLKPDFIIPFKFNKENAQQALLNHYKHKKFLPKTFSEMNQIEKIQGLYVPFWFFDGTADGSLTCSASNSTSHRSGDYINTTTKHYNVQRAGTVDFYHIPTDASKKMPDDLMDSIEPYDYSGLIPFSTAYLPGFLADKFDVTKEESTERACTRAKNSVQQLLRSTINGYGTVSTIGSHTNIKNLKAHYAFLPVWLIHTKWNDKDFLFAMNGQTGKFVGNLPASPGKLNALLLGLTAGIGALVFFTRIADFIVLIIREFLS